MKPEELKELCEKATGRKWRIKDVSRKLPRGYLELKYDIEVFNERDVLMDYVGCFSLGKFDTHVDKERIKEGRASAALTVTAHNLLPELMAAVEELENIVSAKRFSRDHFRDDTEYADWLQSRGRAALAVLKDKEGTL